VSGVGRPRRSGEPASSAAVRCCCSRRVVSWWGPGAVRPPETVRGARTWLGAGLAVVLVLLLAVALASRSPGQDVPDARGPAQPTAVPSCVRDPEAAASTPGRPDPARGRPVRLVATRLDLDARVLAVGLDGAVLVPPDDPSVVGWWRDGALPGSRRGTVLLAGHSWQEGDGVFDHLGDLARGDRIVVVTRRGRVDYEVEVTTTYSHEALARVAGRLFSHEVASQLVATTCTDYRDGAYHANTVVVARPVSGDVSP
jgi:LPXTG-site transpeptidase (sortase) family protein